MSTNKSKTLSKMLPDSYCSGGMIKGKKYGNGGEIDAAMMAANTKMKDPVSGEGLSDYANVGAGIVTNWIGVATDKSQYKGASTGKAIGSTIGAGAGMAIAGPAGAAVGGALFGTVGQLIGQGSDNRKIAANEENRLRRHYANNYNMTTNVDAFGNTFEEGGAVSPEPEAQSPANATKQINVEYGEIMINPSTFDIIRKFSNPNRFSAHKKNSMKEPAGNFVNVPDDMVIIPKKLAPRYEHGDKITRKSILLQILSDQANDPMHNIPEDQQPEGEDQMKEGGWIAGAVNPAHKGYCTPMTKSTCTPRRKAFAMTMKKHHGFHENGGVVFADGGIIDGDPELKGLPPMNPYLFGNVPLKSPTLKMILPTQPALKSETKPWLPLVVIDPVTTNQPSLTLTPEATRINDERIQQLWGTNPAISDTNDVNPETRRSSGTDKSSNRNWGMIARKAIGNLPILAQMANNAQGDPYLGHNENTQFDTAIGYANQLPEDISISGNLAANDRSFATASEGIDQNATPSARAEKAALLGSKIAGDNNSYGVKQQYGATLKSSKLQTLLSTSVAQGADWQHDRGFVMNEERMDKAARENNTFAGLANLSKNELQAQNDMERIKVLNSITKSIDADPFAKQLFKEDPNFANYAINFVTGGYGDVNDAMKEYLGYGKDKNEKTTYNISTTNPKGETTIKKGTRVKTND